MFKRKIVVIGAGGFAREVKWLIADIARHTLALMFVGFVVSDMNESGSHDSTDQLLGDYQWLKDNPEKFDALAIGIGTPGARLKVSQELLPQYGDDYWPPLIHPSSRYDVESTQIAPGVVMCANVVSTVNVSIKPFAMINLSCTIGHESIIGEGSVLNPGVNISGGVTIGAGTLVGSGATILQYLRVGERASIGAGAVVTRDVEDNATVIGVPARPIG